MSGQRDAADRFETADVAVLGVAHALHDTYTAFLSPLIPELMRRLVLNRAEGGLLTVFLQAPSLLQPLIGHAGDRRDLRWLVALAPGLTAAAMCFLPLAPGFPAAAALLVAAGLSAAAIHALAPPIAGRLSGTALGRGMGFWMVGGELGRALGPVIVVSALGLLGASGTPWLMAGGAATSLVLLGQVRRWPRPEPAGDGGAGFLEGVTALRPLIVPLAGLIATRSFLMAASTTFLPLFLREQGASLWLSGAALSILEAAGVAGALAGGTLSDRFGRRRVLAGSLVGGAALLTAMALASGTVRLLLLPLLGLVTLSLSPVLMAVVQEADPARRSLANGLYMALGFTVRSVVVVAVGATADRIGMVPTFLTCAAIGLLGVPFVFRLPRPAETPDPSQAARR